MQSNPHAAREQARWMRPNASLWVRPDAARFFKPGWKLEDVFPALARKYNPNQPRVPSGNPDGGQWTDGATNGRPRVIIDTTNWDSESLGTSDEDSPINDSRVISDADPEGIKPGERYTQVRSGILDIFGAPYYDRGGHHEMPKGVYEKWDLQPETRRVFNDSTTGRLPGGRSVESPSGNLPGHRWNEAHKEYNKAVSELSDRFMERRRMIPKSMTPDDAKELLREIRTSEDPRIRDFNRNIRMLRRVFRFGRGNE